MSSRKYPISTKYGTPAARIQARNELIARRNAYHQDVEPADVASAREVLIRHQGISVLTQLSGPQYVTARATNSGQAGAFLTVVIGTVVIAFRDSAAVRRYAGAWLGHRTTALRLPVWIPTATRINRYAEPGVIVCALGTDSVAVHSTDTALQILIGRISWQVLDQKAFTSVSAMWQQVTRHIEALWPPT